MWFVFELISAIATLKFAKIDGYSLKVRHNDDRMMSLLT